MKVIKIYSQEEFDKLEKTFIEFMEIQIYGRVEVVTARENSQVTAWGNSQVTAWGNSQVTAWENSQVMAWENSQVTARGNSQVTARGNSQVTAWENSQVTAWENSQVTARGNSQVTAWENSQVTAWGNSQVTARGNSQVTAWGNTCVHSYSENSILLFGVSVCFLLNGVSKAIKKSKTAQIIKGIMKDGETKNWLELEGVVVKSKKVILFKRVSEDFKTQENTENETVWRIGKTIKHVNWKPKNQECGDGKFHACSYPYFCDEFRDIKGDKYISIEVETKDLFSWPDPSYPHKIAFKKGKVISVVDKFGKEI